MKIEKQEVVYQLKTYNALTGRVTASVRMLQTIRKELNKPKTNYEHRGVLNTPA
jgi:hypothetical protein